MMLIPGPVEVPESVLKASAYVVNHRSEEFREIVYNSERLLNNFANATNSIMVTGSGTLAVESMIFSLTKPKDHVISVTFGEFGNRLTESLSRRGLKVSEIRKTTEETLLNDDIEEVLKLNRDIKSIFLVHNETGNGTSLKNLREIVGRSKELGLNVYVDSVSGFGAVPIKVNEWGIDAMASCSQKGLASVPGLGIVSLGEELSGQLKVSQDAPQYLDLSISLNFLRKRETSFTPSTGSFNALLKALTILEKEGLENRWERHRLNAEFLRNELLDSKSDVMGFDGNYSDTVIAFKPVLPVKEVVSGLQKMGITVSKGMGKLADEIIRVGNIGMVSGKQISVFLNAYFKLLKMEKEVEPSAMTGKTEISEELLN